VVVLAWLGYDLRALSLGAQARAKAHVAHSGLQVEQALSRFAQAAQGSADPTPRIDEARFLLSLGRTSQAAGVLNSVVRGNPGNVIAWSLLSSATAGTDPRRQAEANQQLFLLFGHPVVYYVAQGTIFSPTGTLSVLPGQVQGHVEGVQIRGDVARFVGWSAMVTKKAGRGLSLVPAEDVLLLVNGRFVAGGTPTRARPDVARAFQVPVAQVGFSIDVPVAQLETPTGKEQVQVFGSSRGVASSLPINCSPQLQILGCSR